MATLSREKQPEIDVKLQGMQLLCSPFGKVQATPQAEDPYPSEMRP